MAGSRSQKELRLAVERNRRELVQSVDELRGKVREVTDWRAHLNRNRTKAVVGAAVAGFVVAGGLSGMTALLLRRRRRD
jgi:hypothetical protein